MDAFEQIYITCMELSHHGTFSYAGPILQLPILGFTGNVNGPDTDFKSFPTQGLLNELSTQLGSSVEVFGTVGGLTNQSSVLVLGGDADADDYDNQYRETRILDLLLAAAAKKNDVVFGNGQGRFCYAGIMFLKPFINSFIKKIDNALRSNLYTEATKFDFSDETRKVFEGIISLEREFIEYVDIGVIDIYDIDFLVVNIKVPEIMLDEIMREKLVKLTKDIYACLEPINPYASIFLSPQD